MVWAFIPIRKKLTKCVHACILCFCRVICRLLSLQTRRFPTCDLPCRCCSTDHHSKRCRYWFSLRIRLRPQNWLNHRFNHFNRWSRNRGSLGKSIYREIWITRCNGNGNGICDFRFSSWWFNWWTSRSSFSKQLETWQKSGISEKSGYI